MADLRGEDDPLYGEEEVFMADTVDPNGTKWQIEEDARRLEEESAFALALRDLMGGQYVVHGISRLQPINIRAQLETDPYPQGHLNMAGTVRTCARKLGSAYAKHS